MSHKKRFNLKVGLVGCGNIARVHLSYITKFIDKEKIALCDRDQLRLEDLAEKWKIKNTYLDLEKMLQSFSPDVVHVLTPPATHKEIATRCMEGGSHVLIEKPMCLSVEEADQIIKASQEYNRLVCVDHMRLFDPLILKAKKLLSSGKLGKIVNISASYSYDFLKRLNTDPASRWMNKLRGGAFFDVMPHPLCLLADFLPNLELKNSTYWRNKDGLITDLWCIFKSSSGSGSLHMSLNIFPLKNYIVFECTKGILTVDLRNFLILLRKQYKFPNAIERVVGNLSVGTQIIKETIGNIFKFFQGKLDSYAGLRQLIYLFYEAIVNNKQSPVPSQDAKTLLALTEKIFHQEQKEVEIKASDEEKLNGVDVLVTGATGFIGRRLTNRLLKEGFKVRILTHRNLTEKELNLLFNGPVEVVRADIYNYSEVEKACKGVNTVYHLAAAMQGSWNYHLDTTVTGTKNILEAIAKTGVKHLVYVSTLNVYNAIRYPKNGLIDEGFPYEENPEKRGCYSHAKLKAEKIVLAYREKISASVSIVRPGLVYGPDRIFPKDVGYRLGRGLVVVIGGGRRLPLVYVDNLVEALLLAGKFNNKAEGIFNVVDDCYPTQKEFIKVYKKLTGENFFVIYLPVWIMFLLTKIIDLVMVILFKKKSSLGYRLRCVNKNVRHSTERIKKILGWSPKVKFEEGLKLAITQELSKVR